METSSQDSVSIYVRNGLGAGLAVQTPELQRDSALRVLPLSGFPSMPIGVFWRGRLSEIAQVFETNWRTGESTFLASPKRIGFDVRRNEGAGLAGASRVRYVHRLRRPSSNFIGEHKSVPETHDLCARQQAPENTMEGVELVHAAGISESQAFWLQA